MKPMHNEYDNNDDPAKRQQSRDLQNFMTPRMTDEERKVSESDDPQDVINLFNMMRAGGELPDGYPDLKVKPSGDRVTGGDFTSMVFMTCLIYSPAGAGGRGYEYMPDSMDELKDWIWLPTPRIGFVYVASANMMRACLGDDLHRLQSIKASLDTLSLIPLSILDGIELPADIVFASEMVNDSRAMHETMDKGSITALQERKCEISGATYEQDATVGLAARRSLWNFLLHQSPRFDVVRVVVHHAKAGEPGEFFFAKVLASEEEISRGDVVPGLALKAGNEEIKAPGTAVVTITDRDDAFRYYDDNKGWDSLPYTNINLSDDARARCRAWEEQVASTFLTPPFSMNGGDQE